ncbi:MAG: M23 family metallopeptidase [Dethiobacter sp.]|jgi:murein DD-endopeptidase MepM/ murein hydrolase activator NlpD|nr:MAG: M23 family metallopeptidase [Dethiobacter sp.]
MIRAYPKFLFWYDVFKRTVSSCLKLNIFLVIVFITLGGGTFFLFPLEVQAMTIAEGPPRPAYYQQLENYQAGVERFREEQEKLKREEALKRALVCHIIQPGETLTRIADLYQTDIGSIVYWNGLSNPHLIFPGQALDILTIEGTLHHVCKGDTIESIAVRYKTEPQVISAFNLLEDPSKLTPGKKMVIPGGIMPLEEKKAVQATLIASRHGERTAGPGANDSPLFKWPVIGNITSSFGRRGSSFHYGLDIAVPYGSYVRAAAPGVVDYTGFQQGYGLMLIINHGGDWSTLYAHNSRLLVEKNEVLTAGQPIALVGASGNATGPHLHLEIAYNGRRLDPLLFLPYNN